MRKSLEEDIFLFSGLKTHAQLFEASRQLLTEDKKVKSFSQFSKDVSSIKSNYNENYLEAEYDFAVGSGLMAERWENFNDSDRYYLQYRTAADDRVRDSHQVLHNTTLPKEDPFWDLFFPPNGWRCRCTVAEVLAYLNEMSDAKKAFQNGESATYQESKNGKNKLEIFRFNPAKEKVAFPPKHPYHKVAGANKAKAAIQSISDSKDRYANTTFSAEKGIKNKGVLEVYTSGKQNKPEVAKNKKALRIAANEGGKYRMLPVIEDGKKNPDALNLKTGNAVDVKVTTSRNGKNIVQNSLKEASKQGAVEVILHITNEVDSYRKMYGALLNSLKSKRNKNVKLATVIYPDGKLKVYDLAKIKKRIK